MSRYSEDIDLVTVRAEPIGQLMGKIKSVLSPWLGKPKYKQTESMVTFYFSYMAEPPMEKPMKVKLEINTRDGKVNTVSTTMVHIKSIPIGSKH